MKKQMMILAAAAMTLVMTSVAMSADLPVEDYPGGIGDDPTDPATPTLSNDSAGRDLPVEDYPGGNGGGGTGGGDVDDPTWTGKVLRDILQNFLAVVGR